ncbi:MAG TPA: ABC transporter permease [Candidatus Dormibacteraeota bacterium]
MAGFLFWAVRRVGIAALTVWLVSVVVFCAIQLNPTNPAIVALGAQSSKKARLLFEHRMHLDEPPLQRYLDWIGGMLHGDFGTSVINGLPIHDLIFQRLHYTAVLAVISIICSTLLALPLAVIAARRVGSFAEVSLSTGAVAISAVPDFVLALAILLIGAVLIRMFPVVSQGIVDGDYSALVLPVISVVLVAAAYVFRLARVSLVEMLAAPYVRAAQLRGFSRRRVLWRHVLPNASIVVVHVVALNAIGMMGGQIIVENVFTYPGLGTLLVQSINNNDLPVIEAVAVITAAFIVTINVIADGLVRLLDPRIRQSAGGR